MSQSLHIVWVTNNFTPYTSGVAQALKAFIPALQELGHRVTIITLDFSGSDYRNDPEWVIRIPCYARFKHAGNPMALPWRPDAFIMRTIARLNPTLIHSHHPFLLGMSALKAARALHKPIVFTHHTLYQAYAYHVPLIPTGLVRRAINWRVQRYCRAVDQVIAPSLPVARILKEQYARPDNVTVVPSAIRSTLIPTGTSCVAKDHYYLLVVSRFACEKNLIFILDAYALLAHDTRYRLIFAGYGPELQALQTYAYQRCKLNPTQVQFMIHPSEGTLTQLYRKAHIFLFSSRTDTQALVLAEAMIHGVPVIACHGPGQDAIVRDGQNGFLVDTAAQMAACIQRCVADQHLYDCLRQQARQTGQRYDPHVLVHDLLRVYYDVVSG